MLRARHSLVPNSVSARRFALVAAPLVTVMAVGVGVATLDLQQPAVPPSAAGANSAAQAAPGLVTSPSTANRTLGTSRSADRVPLVNHRVPKATGKRWTTGNLDLRVEPRDGSKVAGLLKTDKRVAITGETDGKFAEVVIGNLPRWVTASYLSKSKETTPETAGISGAPCPDGSGIEAGLQPASVKVYRAVCAAFPELSAYGGQDGHGEHVNGEAIDFMVPSSSVGQRVADYLFANRSELNLFDIIWSQRIWTIERSSEGFRSMSDRGSATANHYDHVHIKIN
ncbi:MAG: SH3 domain-containing protein [Marmoricola sp.]